MLGQDEHETDTKNWTSLNSASKLTNPLEMVINQFRLLNRWILMSELGVRPKYDFGHKWVVNRHKKSDCKEFSLWAHETLTDGKKQFMLLNCSILMSEQGVGPNYDFLGEDGQETDAKNRTSTNLASQVRNPLEMVKKTFQAFESLNFEVRARS